MHSGIFSEAQSVESIIFLINTPVLHTVYYQCVVAWENPSHGEADLFYYILLKTTSFPELKCVFLFACIATTSKDRPLYVHPEVKQKKIAWVHNSHFTACTADYKLN